mgnify:CR=1 FL=1
MSAQGLTNRFQFNHKLHSLGIKIEEEIKPYLDEFFETKFEHDIGFIKDDCFDVREVNISSFHVIKDTTSGTNE